MFDHQDKPSTINDTYPTLYHNYINVPIANYDCSVISEGVGSQRNVLRQLKNPNQVKIKILRSNKDSKDQLQGQNERSPSVGRIKRTATN